MSDTGPHKPQQDQSSGSGHTALSRHPGISDPIASKRVCFYKSGDPQFSGLRLVINSRTFKTFDALLDSLSKKVPLPFGVRNITTPRGVHAVKTLEELQDGQSYICSDQKKVKPINLEMARKKLPPWYGARPVSGRRRAIQLARQNLGRAARRENSLGVWTPKRLVVFKNGDPSVKHSILLQKKTMQTFESLLDYMSEIMHFPVVKLYTPDGRRVDGLPALILCSGAVIAAGRGRFKSANYDVLKPSLPTRLPATSSHMIPNRLQRKTRKKKSRSSSAKSRNFSLSSEKYFVNQIQNSLTGSVYDFPSNHTGSLEMDPNTVLGSVEGESCTCVGDLGEEHHHVPPDDDIEKSFRVNQDGSMTVEMKVRLTIKEEETVHWSTTLTRSSVANQLSAISVTQPELDNRSTDSSIVPFKDNNELDGYESKENNILPNENGPICEEDEACGVDSEAWHPTSRRAQTPGPRGFRKKQASVESITMETETGIQENVRGTYSYTEETAEGKVTEECCMMRQCNRPIPKPRNMGSTEINNNRSQSTFNSSELLEIQEQGDGITETVLHIYEQQSCQDNFFANAQFRVRSQCDSLHGRPASTDTGLFSASNDFEMDLKRPFTASESLCGRKTESLSLSSEPRVPACKNTNDLYADYVIQTIGNSERECSGSVFGKAKDSPISQNFDKVKRKPRKTKEKQSFLSSLSPYKKQKQKEHNSDTLNESKKAKTDLSSPPDSDKRAETSGQQKPGKRKKKKKGNVGGSGSSKSSKLSENVVSLKTDNSNSLSSEKELIQIEEQSVRNQPVDKPMKSIDLSLRKNVLDLLPAIEPTHTKKVLTKQKSMNEDRSDARESQELSESVSLPSSHSSPSVVNEYVEHWLEKSHPQPTPFMEDMNPTVADMEKRVVFQIRKEEQTISKEPKAACETGRLSTEEYHNCDSNVTEGLASGDPSIEKVEMATQAVVIKPPLEVVQFSTHGQTERLDMRHMLEKLSSLIQAIGQISQHEGRSCLEGSHSLPEFSSHVASTFGSPTQVLLAFLSLMVLKEGISDLKCNERCAEALRMIESLKKIASIEDADELKSSLSDLQKCTSSQLLQSWKSFQELNEKAQNRRQSPNTKTTLSFETFPEQSSRTQEQFFDIQEFVAELSTTTHLQEQLSALVNKRTKDNAINMTEDPMENSEVTGKVIDVEESNIEREAIKFIESNFEEEVGNYVKSIIQSAYILDTERTVREDSKKAAFAEINKAPDDCTEEPINQEEKQEGREAKQVIYEAGTDGEQPLYDVEKQVTFIEHQASYGVEEHIHEDFQQTSEVDQESYAKKGPCCAEQGSCIEEYANDPERLKSNAGVRAGYVEGPVSYEAEETSYVVQSILEEQNNYTEKKYSHEEKLISDAEDQRSGLDEQSIHEEELRCCDIDHGTGMDVQEHNADWQFTQDEEQSSHEEEQNCYGIEQDSFVEEEKSQSHGEEQSNHGEEQNTYVSPHTRNEENQATHTEEELPCVEEQSGYVRTQTTIEEEQAIYDDDQVSHMKEHFRYAEEDQPSCENEHIRKKTLTEEVKDQKSHLEEGCVLSNVAQSVKILEELNNTRHSAPASSLAFSYDSQVSLKRESEGRRVRSIRDMFLARSNVDSQYGHKRLPSPNTSDLSDYRSESSDSSGQRSQASSDTSTESGEDDSGRRSIVKGYVRRTIERLYGRNDPSGKRPPSAPKRKSSPGNNSVGSLTAFHEAKAKVTTDLSYFNATSSYNMCDESTQRVALNANEDAKEGVLIGKGRWLLKDNHLIRKSPPERSAVQENGDSVSVETEPDSESHSAPYSHFGSHDPFRAVSSSPELENPGKIPVNKCTYFSLPHGSDSDLLQDDLTVKAKKDIQLSPMQEEPKECAERNGSLPAFASEFRKTDNKVHPQSGEPVVVTQPSRGQGSTHGRAVQEQDPLEMLYVMCGQRCPIL